MITINLKQVFNYFIMYRLRFLNIEFINLLDILTFPFKKKLFILFIFMFILDKLFRKFIATIKISLFFILSMKNAFNIQYSLSV